MSAKSAKIKKFQVSFLKFLDEKKIPDVHIYHHLMNYWSNDQSEISLQELKEAITDLCNENCIVSKNNSHLSIGVAGISEEDQKNNAVCSILDAGRKFVKKEELKRTLKIWFVVGLLLAAAYAVWRLKVVAYFFR
jgi:hypothetical protein